jgi:hypothetical protein
MAGGLRVSLRERLKVMQRRGGCDKVDSAVSVEQIDPLLIRICPLESITIIKTQPKFSSCRL